jgi:hypothetical protein
VAVGNGVLESGEDVPPITNAISFACARLLSGIDAMIQTSIKIRIIHYPSSALDASTIFLSLRNF